MGQNYVISRGHKHGQQLTPAQRMSSQFAEEPVVLGKVLRRGLPPRVVTPEQFEANKLHLLRLQKAGAIEIIEPDETPLTPEESDKIEEFLGEVAKETLSEKEVEMQQRQMVERARLLKEIKEEEANKLTETAGDQAPAQVAQEVASVSTPVDVAPVAPEAVTSEPKKRRGKKE